MKGMKIVISRAAVGVGAIVMAVLALPTAVGIGLICLVRTGVDRLTACLER